MLLERSYVKVLSSGLIKITHNSFLLPYWFCILILLMKTSEETEVALDILDSVDEDEENSEVKEVS